MGLFSNIKRNLSHGGVKLEMQAPASISEQDASLPIHITLTSTDAPAHINSIKAEIIAESHNQNYNPGTQGGSAGSTTTYHTVARADNIQPLDLTPGEPQQVQIDIVMNAGAALSQSLPEGSAAAGLMRGLQQLQTVGEALNSQSYTYYLQVSADVEGIALDPSKRQPLQILKPGQVGGGFNINF